MITEAKSRSTYRSVILLLEPVVLLILLTFGQDWLAYCGVSYGAGTPVSAFYHSKVWEGREECTVAELVGHILTLPTPPACGEVNDRNRKKGLSDLEELYRNSTVVFTNTSEEEERVRDTYTDLSLSYLLPRYNFV